MQKDGDAVKEALDQLSQAGWAKKWSSQPYVSCRTVIRCSCSWQLFHFYFFFQLYIQDCRGINFLFLFCLQWDDFPFQFHDWQTSLRELVTLGIKNAENLAIPSVRNDVSCFGQTKYIGCMDVEIFGTWNGAMIWYPFWNFIQKWVLFYVVKWLKKRKVSN